MTLSLRWASIVLFGVVSAWAQATPPENMATYVVGFLKKGPKWTAESTAETKRIQEGHMAHLRRMGESGKLIVAGPFMDNGDLRGMFIFIVSLEEAKAIAEGDPAVQSGRLALEFHPWWAGKGLKVDPWK